MHDSFQVGSLKGHLVIEVAEGSSSSVQFPTCARRCFMKLNMSVMWPIAASMLLKLGSSYAAEPIWSENLETHYGSVSVGEIGPAFMHNALLVDGKKVFVGPSDAIVLWRAYRLANADAVLFSTGCMGSSCGEPDHLYFLILGQGKKPQIISNPDFYSADSEVNPDAIPKRRNLSLDLGFENGLKKWAELKASRVVVHRDPSNASMAISDCEWIHAVTVKSCTQALANSVGVACASDVPTGSDLTEMSNLTSLAHKPGFNSVSLKAICRTQCETGVQTSLKTFMENVCGIK
ncbi:MAG: hypothetical protein EKK47_00955 [Burkholderiales bacterium]|nr:MAG: hypothetical protein EKK47_00955 [Burkholderiales bacterium]